MVLVLTFTFIVIALIGAPRLLKARQWRELVAFTLLLLFGYGLAVPQTLGITLPNPLDWIEFILKPLVTLME